VEYIPAARLRRNAVPVPQGAASTVCGLGNEKLDGEGRVLTLEYPSFFLVNVYVPQSQGGLERWYYRLEFDTAFYEYARVVDSPQSSHSLRRF
jgi:exonuclease III